ncbi:MAG TPA: cation:proton antiporter [Saprospiraceae bacterium]|nr:cation:proton antiporter [Saprospiraceae bacterium]HMP25487.1 cation:proton antiporter [Saprospiraceae bacterium]
MTLLLDIAYPIKDPVIVFAIVLFVIFLVPLLLNKIKVPGIIGMILAGTALGPTGFNVLERSYAIELFGTVGLLYIMFQAGLEVDMNDFKKTRNKSLTFGLLSFAFPQIFGTLGAVYLLGLSWPSAILLASMFASHTLISYPIISRLDLTKNESVTITIGGTIIVNILALLVLAVIASAATGELNDQFWINLGVSLSIFVFLVLWVGPRVVRWFFRNVESEGVSQYIFVLSFVFAASFGAKLAGVEAIIGAFLAGLAINPLIPATSTLMNRIDFVGGALFIPLFLINVGMLTDLRILLQGKEALIAVGIIIGLAVVLKWIPAKITAWLFRYRREEGQLIFGLSVAQAASTLAAALVGYELQLIDDNVLNGIIMMILVTCMVSSFAVEMAGKKLAIAEAQKKPEAATAEDRILVPISNPDTTGPLIELAILLKKPKSNEPIYPLSIINDDESAQERILITQRVLEKAVKNAAASETVLKPITRVDLHIGGGITRVVKELTANRILIGWHGKYNPKDYLFGTVLDYLLTHISKMIMVTSLKHPLNTMSRVVLVLPDNAEREPGFTDWVEVVKRLSHQIGAKVHLVGGADTLQVVEQAIKKDKPVVETTRQEFDDWEDFLVLVRYLKQNDLLLILQAREGTVSHHGYMSRIPRHLSRHFQDTNFIVLYPEQKL